MRISLDDQEIMKAIRIYMALKGFEIGNNFNFHTHVRDGLKSVEFDAKPAEFDIEKIKEFANK